MLSLRTVVAALYGAFRLARFDAGGMAFFDTTIGGFWRSFFASVIVAPVYLAMLSARLGAGVIETHPLRYFLIEIIAYVIGWVAFPLAMVAVSRLLEREERYLGYIVAYNWAGVWQNGLYLPLLILAFTGVLAPAAADALGLVAFGYILVYLWFVARTALAVPGVVAVGPVVLDILLGVLINAFAEGML